MGPGSHDGRFAPSPTGPLHLGNLRTALLAWLFARAGDGRFLIRVEDLDASRSRPEHEAGQLADLAALGLVSDEPVVRQSERTEIYEDAIDRLDRQGALYPLLVHAGGDPRGRIGAPRAAAGGRLPRDLPAI